MAGRDLEKELADAARGVGLGSSDELQPVALLRRLGVTLPPTLHSVDIDASLPPGGTMPPAGAIFGVPAVGMDVWSAPDRVGFAPTLDLDAEDEEAQPAGSRDVVERIGRYDVIGELGSGGMGRVVEVLDRDLGRRLAVKVVRDPSRLNEARLARFVTEAQLTAQLEHPNIVPIHELGVTQTGQIYYAMKKVEGTSLAEVLDQLRVGDAAAMRRWTRRRLLSAFAEVCLAAGYAHRRGVIHRDLKPENIMLGEFGEVLVLDWGLARLVSGPDDAPDSWSEVDAPRGRALTREGAATGTPGYLSPEQARGARDAIGPPSDVWSLGAVLYEILTGSTPIDGGDVVRYLTQVAVTAIEDPRDRAPDRHISEDLAVICLRCLHLDPAQRYLDGRELAQAMEDWLEGARRRREARERLREAGTAWTLFRKTRERLDERRAEVQALEVGVATWTPVEEKRALLEARAGVAALELAQAEAFGEAVAGGEQALAHDPGNAAARAFLARACLARMTEAEQRGDRAETAFYAARVRAYDDGPLRAVLIGDGALSLSSDPVGAEVHAERYVSDGLVLRLESATLLGRTPLERVPLAMGSWRLRLVAPGRADTLYPVAIGRGEHWEGPTVRMLAPGDVPEGWTHVPAGPARLGDQGGAIDALPVGRVHVDDVLIATTPVSLAQWLEFLDALHARDPEAAWAHVPRREEGLDHEGVRYLARPAPGERYRLPEADADGDVWLPEFPVFSVSAADAEAFAAWRTDVTGVHHRLPTEQEWEKAARGVDGRAWPWGDVAEATLCWNREGQPGRPQPRRIGARPYDVSPYGVRDVAGGVSEWCAAGPDPTRRVARGGSWAGTLRQARLANRLPVDPRRVHSYLGLRLVRALPTPPVAE